MGGGNKRGQKLNSSSTRISASTDAPGSPTSRRVVRDFSGEGMAASTSNEDIDAMCQSRPHGAIAVGSRGEIHISPEAKSTLRTKHA